MRQQRVVRIEGRIEARAHRRTREGREAKRFMGNKEKEKHEYEIYEELKGRKISVKN